MKMPRWWKTQDAYAFGIAALLFTFIAWIEAGQDGFIAGVARVLNEPIWLLLTIVCLMYRVITKNWLLR